MNEITLKEFSEIFKYVIENNKRLEDEGKKTTAIGVTSSPGIGKTAEKLRKNHHFRVS